MTRVVYCLILIAFMTGAQSQTAAAKGGITVKDTVEFRDFSALAVCPGSKLIAARIDSPSIPENRINHEWRIIEWPSKNIRFTADAGETLAVNGYPERSHAQWSPDCQWLYYRKLQDSAVVVWRLNSKSGAQAQVTRDVADILRFKLGEDANALIYETGASRAAILAAEAHEYQNGVLIDENLWPWMHLTKSNPLYGRWAPYRLWSISAAGHLLSREPPKYKAIAIDNREVRKATQIEIAQLTNNGPNWLSQNNFDYLLSSTGEQAAVVLKKKMSPMGGMLSVRLATVRRDHPSDVHECSDDRCKAYRLAPLGWSQDGSSIYFIADQSRVAAEVYEWSLGSGNVRRILKTDGLLGALASGGRHKSSGPCPTIGDIAFCTAEDAGNPPRLIAMSLTSGSIETVYDPNAELRNRFSLRTERVSWKDNLGRNSIGVLVYPRGFKKGTRYPLVISTYLCRGFLSGGVADGGPEYVLAEDGFLVLCIDVNNDIPQGLLEKYSKAQSKYVSSLAEYESAVEMLVKKRLVDRHRVGITGLSFSAMAVSYALSHSTAIHAAALRHIGMGLFEPGNEMFLRPGMWLTDEIYEYYGVAGSEEEKKKAYQELSISLRADRIVTPTLVQASDSEYLGSLPAFAALQKLGKSVEMIVFPDEAHFLAQPFHRYVNFTRNRDWFRFWLQGYEVPDPEKADQYARWRKMQDKRCAREDLEAPSYCDQ